MRPVLQPMSGLGEIIMQAKWRSRLGRQLVAGGIGVLLTIGAVRR